MNTLKIEIPEGFEIENFDKQTGTVSLKPKLKPLIERIKTFEDVCEEMGKDVNDYRINIIDPIEDRAIVAMRKLWLIYELFQDGVELDPHDTNQKKWYPWFDLKVSAANPSGFRFIDSDYTYTASRSVIGPLLWLPDEKTANYVGKTFEAEFKAIVLISNI